MLRQKLEAKTPRHEAMTYPGVMAAKMFFTMRIASDGSGRHLAGPSAKEKRKPKRLTPLLYAVPVSIG